MTELDACSRNGEWTEGRRDPDCSVSCFWYIVITLLPFVSCHLPVPGPICVSACLVALSFYVLATYITSIIQNCLHDVRDPQLLQIGVSLGPRSVAELRLICKGTNLSGTDEDDRLTRDVGHGECGSDLVIDSVPFGDEHTVDTTAFAGSASRREVLESTIELDKLVDSFVSDEGFPNEDDLIRVVRCDELREGSHKRLPCPDQI
jgi:hypothetical protein